MDKGTLADSPFPGNTTATRTTPTPDGRSVTGRMSSSDTGAVRTRRIAAGIQPAMPPPARTRTVVPSTRSDLLRSTNRVQMAGFAATALVFFAGGGTLLGFGIPRLSVAKAKIAEAKAVRASEGPGPRRPKWVCGTRGLNCRTEEVEDRSGFPSYKLLSEAEDARTQAIMMVTFGSFLLAIGTVTFGSFVNLLVQERKPLW